MNLLQIEALRSGSQECPSLEPVPLQPGYSAVSSSVLSTRLWEARALIITPVLPLGETEPQVNKPPKLHFQALLATLTLSPCPWRPLQRTWHHGSAGVRA